MRSVFSVATQSCIYPCGDPSWVQHDEQIISNLDLPFQVVWTGSEDALLAEVSSAYSRQEPVLFFFYSPTPYSSNLTCPRLNCRRTVTNATPIRPRLIAPIRRTSCLNYGSDAQIEMLAMLNEAMTVEEAAQAWVDAHEDVWRILLL